MRVTAGGESWQLAPLMDDQELDTRIISIDPAPRAEVDAQCDEVLRMPLEDVPMDFFDTVTAEDRYRDALGLLEHGREQIGRFDRLPPRAACLVQSHSERDLRGWRDPRRSGRDGWAPTRTSCAFASCTVRRMWLKSEPWNPQATLASVMKGMIPSSSPHL